MKGFVQTIEDLMVTNQDFHRVLGMTESCQLAAMSLLPKAEIGTEAPTRDPFLRVKEHQNEHERTW